MQCKLMKGSFNSSSSSTSSSSTSTDEGIMAWPQFPLQQQNSSRDIVFPHQIGSVDRSCSSWPGHVWRQETSQYWLESDFNNNKNSNNHLHASGRVSFSSDCSDMSTDDFSISSDVEDSDNTNIRNINHINHTSSTTVPSPPPLLNADITEQHSTSFKGEEDQNNNCDQYSNNNITITALDTNFTTTTNTTTPINTTPVYTEKKSKKKSDSPVKSRLLDDEGYIRRAACVCLDETESKVLLVSSKKDSCSWLVPGGGMETGEDMATAAIREAWEEAGVQGQITKYLGLFETNHQNGTKKHRTAVFVVSVKQVMADYPEAYLGRCRQWFTLEEALLHLARTRPLQSAYLQLLLVSRLNVASA